MKVILCLGLPFLLLCVLGQTDIARAQPGFDREVLALEFAQFDAGVNNGRGYSESPASSSLAWGESYYLNAYVMMYHATGDTKWLDKIVDHVDRMIANMSDHNGDGVAAWHTDRYSVSRMRASALHNRGTARIAPAEATETNIDRAHEAQDAVYMVERVGTDRFVVRDVSRWETVYDGPYNPGGAIPGIAGFELRVEGWPEVGDKFRVETWGVQPLDYAVHDGMIAYPIARFIELGLRGAGLKDRYAARADAYLRTIETRILEKQERYWLEVTPGMGAYRSTEGACERSPNRVLPHNQYLALGRAYLVLKDVSDNPLFLERATQMAAHFKRYLQETGDAYTWAYWDWTEAGQAGQSSAEDTSHGHIDIEFVVEAYRRGVVFTEADLQRFARTLTEQMWNGSVENPIIGSRVDRVDGDAATIRGWIELCRWDARIWDLYWALFQRLNRPGLDIASVLYTRAVLDGTTMGGALPSGALDYRFGLGRSFPNPFNQEAEIWFTVGGNGAFDRQEVTLRIYNLLGQQVRVLMRQPMPAGNHRVVWDGRDDVGRAVGSGVYLCRLEAEAFGEVKKILLVR